MRSIDVLVTILRTGDFKRYGGIQIVYEVEREAILSPLKLIAYIVDKTPENGESGDV